MQKATIRRKRALARCTSRREEAAPEPEPKEEQVVGVGEGGGGGGGEVKKGIWTY